MPSGFLSNLCIWRISLEKMLPWNLPVIRQASICPSTRSSSFYLRLKVGYKRNPWQPWESLSCSCPGFLGWWCTILGEKFQEKEGSHVLSVYACVSLVCLHPKLFLLPQVHWGQWQLCYKACPAILTSTSTGPERCDWWIGMKTLKGQQWLEKRKGWKKKKRVGVEGHNMVCFLKTMNFKEG